MFLGTPAGDDEPVRQPAVNVPETKTGDADTKQTSDESLRTRKTGAVGRPRVEPVPAVREPAYTPPVRNDKSDNDKKPDRTDRQIEPIRQPPAEPPRERKRDPEPVRQPVYEPPPRTTKSDDPPKPQPRNDPPPSKPEPSRRSDPPPKSDPAPAKKPDGE